MFFARIFDFFSQEMIVNLMLRNIKSRYVNIFVDYLSFDFDFDFIDAAFAKTRCVWKLIEALPLSFDELNIAYDKYGPFNLIPLINLIAFNANRNSEFRAKVLQRTREYSIISLLGRLRNITSEEITALLNRCKLSGGHILTQWGDGSLHQFLACGTDLRQRRYYLSFENLVPALEISEDIATFYMTCPYRDNPRFREVFLRVVPPVFICDLTTNEIAHLIDTADSRDYSKLTGICKSLGNNVELREKILQKTDKTYLAKIFQHLDNPSVDETIYVFENQLYTDDETNVAYENLFLTFHKNDPRVRRMILQFSHPTELNDNMRRLSSPSYEEFQLAFSRTLDKLDLWGFCPYKTQELFATIQTGVESEWAYLCDKPDEFIIMEIMNRPSSTYFIYYNTFQKSSEIVRDYAVRFCPDYDMFFLHDVIPEPTYEETSKIFHACGPNDIIELYEKCFYKRDPEIRQIALTSVPDEDIMTLWRLMTNHTINETAYAFRKAATTTSVRPYIIFAESLLYNNRFLQDIIMTDSISHRHVVDVYCFMTNPTLNHSLLLIDKCHDTLYAFSVCVHQTDKRVRRLFIKKVAHQSLPVVLSAFSLLPDRTLDEEIRFLRRIRDEDADKLFQSCNFFDNPRLRKVYLTKSELLHRAYFRLLKIPNPKLHEIEYVKTRFETYH